MEGYRILATDGGAHPPEKWALFTAQEIFNTDKLSGERKLEAARVQLAIAERLAAHHDAVQRAEKDALAADADARFAASHDMAAMVNAAMLDVLGAVRGTAWEAHYANDDVREAVRTVLTHHFTTAAHIERLWHHDRNPSAAGAAYKAGG